jgi:uncharacterized protein
VKKVGQWQPLCDTISVINIDEVIKRIEIAGGKIIKPKFAITSYGWLASSPTPMEIVTALCRG